MGMPVPSSSKQSSGPRLNPRRLRSGAEAGWCTGKLKGSADTRRSVREGSCRWQRVKDASRPVAPSLDPGAKARGGFIFELRGSRKDLGGGLRPPEGACGAV